LKQNKHIPFPHSSQLCWIHSVLHFCKVHALMLICHEHCHSEILCLTVSPKS
jgi:hypothetical protein